MDKGFCAADNHCFQLKTEPYLYIDKNWCEVKQSVQLVVLISKLREGLKKSSPLNLVRPPPPPPPNLLHTKNFRKDMRECHIRTHKHTEYIHTRAHLLCFGCSS